MYNILSLFGYINCPMFPFTFCNDKIFRFQFLFFRKRLTTRALLDTTVISLKDESQRASVREQVVVELSMNTPP